MKLTLQLALLSFLLLACSKTQNRKVDLIDIHVSSDQVSAQELYKTLSAGIDPTQLRPKEDGPRECLEAWKDYLVLKLPFFISALETHPPASMKKECLSFHPRSYKSVNYQCWRRGETKTCTNALKRWRSQLIFFLSENIPEDQLPPKVLLHQVVSLLAGEYSEEKREQALSKLKSVLQHSVATQDVVPLFLLLYSKEKEVKPSVWKTLMERVDVNTDLAVLALLLESKNRKTSPRDLEKKAHKYYRDYNEKGDIDYFLSRYYLKKGNRAEAKKWLKLALKKDQKNARYQRSLKSFESGDEKVIYSALLENPIYEYLEKVQ